MLHLIGWVFLLIIFVCFPSTIEELDPESSRILSEWNLALTSLPFTFPSITEVKWLFTPFWKDLIDGLSYVVLVLPPVFFLAIPLHYSAPWRPYIILPQCWGFQIWSSPAIPPIQSCAQPYILHDVVQPKTTPFYTCHQIWVNYKILSQLSQPISIVFSSLNSAQQS